MPRDFLLEVGSDEIPARYLPLAFEQLESRATAALRDRNLSYGKLSVFGTPRRLALFVSEVEETGGDKVQKVRGPSRAVAFGPDGQPTKALLGFARSVGCDPSALTVESDGAGEYMYGVRRELGRPATDILKDIMPDVIMGMECPHPLRWGERDWKWYRAIRWIVCLFGADVVPLEIAGRPAGKATFGHRTLHPGPAEILEASGYFDAMEKCHVIVDQAARRESIVQGARSVAQAADGTPVLDDELLSEVTHLTEHPSAFLGSFDEKYLTLPDQVLVTAMRHHQRYFPVESAGGEILSRFVGVRDGDAEEEIDTVRKGNEWVLRSRLSDAEFFYEQDRKTALEDRLEDLKGIRFLRDAGTVYDKALRLAQIAGDLSSKLGLSLRETELATEAARLCKCDLATSLVREFPELQGVMGGIYAADEGLDPMIGSALSQHYFPRGAKDDLPEGDVPSVVALADKLDTLAVAMTLGLEVSGSQDPLGLRRASSGVVSILMENRYDLDLDAASKVTLELAAGEVARASSEPAERLKAFLQARVEAVLLDKGYQAGVVRAVLGGRERRVHRLEQMAGALSAITGAPSLSDVVTGWRRTSVLGKAGLSREVSPDLLKEDAERELYSEVESRKGEAASLSRSGEFAAYLALLGALRPHIDRCLDNVLIMAPDPDVKANRIALLGVVSDMFTWFGDFSHVLSLV